jgi:hypothetical protein
MIGIGAALKRSTTTLHHQIAREIASVHDCKKWNPFKLGAGSAPGYCMSLDPEHRQQLREKLEKYLPRNEDGSIDFKARSWATKAVAP